MRYELFVYDKETEELIRQEQAEKLSTLIRTWNTNHERCPWVIMQKPDEGGSWECYRERNGGQELHYKKIMEEE